MAIPCTFLQNKVRWCNLCRECRDELLKKHIAVITWLHVLCLVRNQPRNWVLLQFILEIPNYHCYTEKSSHLWRMMVMVHLWTSMVCSIIYNSITFEETVPTSHGGGAIYYVDDWLHWLCRLEHVLLWNSLHWLTETKLLWCTYLWPFLLPLDEHYYLPYSGESYQGTAETEVYRMGYLKANSTAKHLYRKTNISNN